ncbi:MAG: DUF493 domain-containing protein [Proteobacteria bacterium]|nr:DUF493 domain-containing protein [Pseudomonadota bacterium]
MDKKPALPNIDLIKELHSFPTMFTFKVIGDHHDEFVSDVLNRTTGAIGASRKIEHSMRLSSGGNHSAISLSVHCSTAEEVLVVYSELLKVSGLRALF